MRLSIATPLAIVVEADNVGHLRAEDETGAFGILAGHADFVTALSISVVSWKEKSGAEHHVAVRGGMLQVRDGVMINIATPEAVQGDDLRRLESEVLSGLRSPSRCQRARRSRRILTAWSRRSGWSGLSPNGVGVTARNLLLVPPSVCQEQ